MHRASVKRACGAASAALHVREGCVEAIIPTDPVRSARVLCVALRHQALQRDAGGFTAGRVSEVLMTVSCVTAFACDDGGGRT